MKMRGGGYTPNPEQPDSYNGLKNYEEVVKRFRSNLNLTTKEEEDAKNKSKIEGSIEKLNLLKSVRPELIPFFGCFNYFKELLNELKGRPLIVKQKPIVKNLEILATDTQTLHADFDTICELYPYHDPVITYYLMIGCIQQLRNYMNTTWSYISLIDKTNSKTNYPVFKQYLTYKVVRITSELSKINDIMKKIYNQSENKSEKFKEDTDKLACYLLWVKKEKGKIPTFEPNEFILSKSMKTPTALTEVTDIVSITPPKDNSLVQAKVNRK